METVAYYQQKVSCHEELCASLSLPLHKNSVFSQVFMF
jgi:hypothetical protein